MPLNPLLTLAQTLHLSPSLLQSMEILQMNTLELAQYLEGLALENPVMAPVQEASPSWEAFAAQVPWLKDSPSPAALGNGTLPEVGALDAEPDSLSFLLRDQLSRLSLDPPLQALCNYLVDLLSPRGWLEEEDLSGLVQAGVPQPLLDQAVSLLQSLEPAGVGARSLSECLSLQLLRLPGDHQLALLLCRDHLEALSDHAYRSLARRLSVSEAEIQGAAEEILQLNPDPAGDVISPAPIASIRPDAWVAEIQGELRIFSNQWDLPQFHLSPDYLRMAQTGEDPEAELYLRQKIQQARWVLQCVQRRQNTLERCISALVTAQEGFFRGRQELPDPLLRRQLAEILSLHPSTVTRTLGRKYLQCRQGLFPTSYFFSRQTGGGNWSIPGLQARISRIIREEDPHHPLSDQAIAALLAGKGIALARRTVTKYRETLGLPSSYRRKIRSSTSK